MNTQSQNVSMPEPTFLYKTLFFDVYERGDTYCKVRNKRKCTQINLPDILSFERHADEDVRVHDILNAHDYCVDQRIKQVKNELDILSFDISTNNLSMLEFDNFVRRFPVRSGESQNEQGKIVYSFSNSYTTRKNELGEQMTFLDLQPMQRVDFTLRNYKVEDMGFVYWTIKCWILDLLHRNWFPFVVNESSFLLSREGCAVFWGIEHLYDISNMDETYKTKAREHSVKQMESLMERLRRKTSSGASPLRLLPCPSRVPSYQRENWDDANWKNKMGIRDMHIVNMGLTGSVFQINVKGTKYAVKMVPSTTNLKSKGVDAVHMRHIENAEQELKLEAEVVRQFEQVRPYPEYLTKYYEFSEYMPMGDVLYVYDNPFVESFYKAHDWQMNNSCCHYLVMDYLYRYESWDEYLKNKVKTVDDHFSILKDLIVIVFDFVEKMYDPATKLYTWHDDLHMGNILMQDDDESTQTLQQNVTFFNETGKEVTVSLTRSSRKYKLIDFGRCGNTTNRSEAIEQMLRTILIVFNSQPPRSSQKPVTWQKMIVIVSQPGASSSLFTFSDDEYQSSLGSTKATTLKSTISSQMVQSLTKTSKATTANTTTSDIPEPPADDLSESPPISTTQRIMYGAYKTAFVVGAFVNAYMAAQAAIHKNSAFYGFPPQS